MKTDEIRLGVASFPFIPNPDYPVYDGFLHYADGRLTDNYNILNVFFADNGKFRNTGDAYIFVSGGVRKGDPIVTCPIRGIGMVSQSAKEFAFAEALEDRQPELFKEFPIIGRVHVKLLQCQDFT